MTASFNDVSPQLAAAGRNRSGKGERPMFDKNKFRTICA